LKKGIIAEPNRKMYGNAVSYDLKQKAVKYYQDSEFTRMCSGNKEFVSVKIDGEKKYTCRSIHVNARELHLEFICSLRSKWCITVVVLLKFIEYNCVCQTHQNANNRRISKQSA